MNSYDATLFIFKIAKEVKRSFESPVILFTHKDYAEPILKALVEMRSALMNHSTPENLAAIVTSFHLDWLKAIDEIEHFKKRVNDTPRDCVIRSIEFTIQCMKKRQETFQNLIDTIFKSMTPEEQSLLQSDISIITDMRQIVNYALAEKQKSLRFQADQADFYVLIMNEIEELMNWLDKLNDFLAIQFSKILDFKVRLSPKDLTKTLQQIIDEVAECPIPQAKTVAHEIAAKGRKLSNAIRISSLNDIEIAKIIEKIKHLEDRINRLRAGKSSAVVALQHKAMYLEDRLRSLENLKLSLNSLKNQQVLHDEGAVDEEAYNIFNHLLPLHERCKLVNELVKLWKNSIVGGDHILDTKSIISILSVADIKEVFSDEIGHFSVDKYGRKIYTLNGDDAMYQLNERNEMIPVQDDDYHVYYYDECGRYYLNEKRQRVYKAYKCDSEYMLHDNKLQDDAMLLKFSERADGMRYYYDHLGRYYIDKDKRRIYRERYSEETYLNDGLGNLVKIREEWPEYMYNQCPKEPMLLEESLYVKAVVGDALKKCLAQVIMVQPENPINFLADCLEQYRRNEEERQKRLKEESFLKEARENYPSEISDVEDDRSTIAIPHEQESDADSHFIKYTTQF